MSSSAIVVSRLGDVAVYLLPVAVTEQQVLIATAAQVKAVEDDFGQACAVDLLKEINALLKLVEKSRSDVKGPVLDLGRKIDSLAKGFSAPLAAEATRISKLVTAYQVEQRKKAEAAERARQAELRRIEAEQAAAAQEAAKAAEAARQAEMAKQQAAEDKMCAFTKQEASQAEKAALDAGAEKRRLQELHANAMKQAAELERIKLQASSMVVRQADKPTGLIVREVWKFEVTDIWALASRNADLVRIEPNTAAINAAIREGMRACPGLRIWSETETGVRS